MDVRWPVIIFDDWLSPAVVPDVDKAYDYVEPSLYPNRRISFDRSFAIVSFEASAGEQGFLPRLRDGVPEPARFRQVARVSYRLHGPRAVWRRGRLWRSDQTDTRGLDADQLWAALAELFTVE